jgi:hypothetical protein
MQDTFSFKCSPKMKKLPFKCFWKKSMTTAIESLLSVLILEFVLMGLLKLNPRANFEV